MTRRKRITLLVFAPKGNNISIHSSPYIHSAYCPYLTEKLDDHGTDAEPAKALVLAPKGDVGLEGQEFEEEVEHGGEDGDGCMYVCGGGGGGFGWYINQKNIIYIEREYIYTL